MHLCVRGIDFASFYNFQFDCGIVLTVRYFFNSGLSFKNVSSEEVNTTIGLTVWYFLAVVYRLKLSSEAVYKTIVPEPIKRREIIHI